MSWVMRAGSREVAFGNELSGLGLMSTPAVSIDFDAEMRANPRGDGRRVGRDTIAGQSVSLMVEARPDHRPLPDVVRELLSVWRADEVRHTGGKLATLTSPEGLTAYGRPRPVGPDQQYRLFDVARAELVFECIDDLWYGPAVSVVIPLFTASTGGLPIPAAVPWVIGGGSGQSDRVVTVEGTQATWPVFTLHGPIKDPFIDVPGVGRLQFSVSLAYDQALTVDTRHWNRSIMRAGADLPGALLASGARLSDMAMQPGAYRIIFGGYDPTSTSRLTVQVEPAFTSF